MKKYYTYQLYGNRQIFANRLRAHRELCKINNKNEDDFIPCKETIHRDETTIHYPDGHTIVIRILK